MMAVLSKKGRVYLVVARRGRGSEGPGSALERNKKPMIIRLGDQICLLG